MNLIWNRRTRSTMLRLVQYLPIRRGRVMCVCWGGNEYSCNPRAITDWMVQSGEVRQFEVWYAFVNPERFQPERPDGIRFTEIGSLEYFRLLATSQFIISNTHLGGWIFWPFPKRKGQIYILTNHGGFGIKKIEWDAASKLSTAYMSSAAEDVGRVDLMLSNSDFTSRVFRSAYRYPGEVLEQGLPRNDAFVHAPALTGDVHYLIYTPTFRSKRRDVYGFDVDRVITALEQRFGGQWYIRVSSHPNMRRYYKEIYDFSHPRMIDVGLEDLQPLLLTSDVLITDYSSAEMDFSLLRRPIFQLCRDRHDYDRGFYIDPETLPFPYAETDDQLIDNILHFDQSQYLSALDTFNSSVVGLHETGHAAQSVVAWMLARMAD